MTPKEKAEQLIIKFEYHSFHENSLSQCRENAKECALIVIDEILNEYNDFMQTREQFEYWQNIKQEIEKL